MDSGGNGDARVESVPAQLTSVVSSRSLDTRSARPLLARKSLRRTESGASVVVAAASPLRRPSTAASTHSRIHQALRRNDNGFVFSSKGTTVDGMVYTSRFQQVALPRPASSQPRSKTAKTIARLPKRDSLMSASPPSRSPPRSPTAPQPRPSLPRTPSQMREDTASIPHKSDPPSKQRAQSTAHLQQRHPHGKNATTGGSPREKTPVEMATNPATAIVVPRHEEAAYVQRKRRCARTFEEMIFARVQTVPNSTNVVEETDATAAHTGNQAPEGDANDRGGIEKLLANGIIPSIVALCTLSDQATQSHCCRSLYYLSRVHAVRKPMVTHGVITTIKQLSRSAAPKARQDLAATLCHLCEEPHLIEAVLFEGIDRCLVRLFATTHAETKRICALTVFNISSEASKIKHFVEPFAQLLISSTKSCYGHTAASSYLLKAVYNVARLPMFHVSLLGENIPRFLAAQIPHVASDIQILALQALVALCDAKTNRMQILSQAFCKLLEKMLTVTNPEVQEMALLVVLQLSQDDGSRIKLCNWIPVASLIHTATARLTHFSTLSSTSSSLVFLDSCILRNLCDSVLTHHELLEENAMPLLLSMSRVSDHDIKSNAVCALVSIIASSPEESAEFVVDILDELITLTRSSQPRICLFAIGAVYNIACNDDCLPLLVTSSELIDCLFELARDASQDNVAELTAAVIYRLLTHDVSSGDTPRRAIMEVDTPTLLLQRGFFHVLVRLMSVFPTARPYAVHALYLLSHSDADSDPSLFPHGSDGVWDLVCALNNEKTTRVAPVEPDSVTARSAVTLIAELASQRVNHSILVKNGAVFRFLRSLRRVTRPAPGARAGINSLVHDDETIVMNSAFVFYSLAVSHEGCEQLIREQGIEELIHMARTTKLASSEHTHRVKELFMMTMCRVSSFMGLEVKLIEHGAIDAIMVLALVSSADSPIIKALCIKTLANCLVAKVCARPLIEHGVIWALASLAVVDSPETRSACAVSLCNLATVPFMLARFLDAGAPRALVYILQQCEHEPTTALVVVKAIANLVANEKLCLAFVNEEIERHLSVFFASPQSSNEMRQLAAMVLLRVTSANDAVISLDHLKHGVFVWMEQIITMEDDGLVKNCMLTVHDLTCSTTIDVVELDVDHILRITIQVFSRPGRSGDVLTMCLWILYNLSCQLTVLHQLIRPEILTFLRQQVPAVTLPFPLPFTTPSHAHLTPLASTMTLINGAIAQTTAALAQSLDAKLVCYILHNLSCAREGEATTKDTVLASLVNARCVAILSDLYLQRDDLKETCAVAACNIAVGRVNSTRVVDDRTGDLVIHFIFSLLFHRCHYRLVSVAIRKMVNAPGNQPLLLHRGIARAIVRVLELLLEGGCADVETTRNLIASLCVLSKCGSHVPRLLQDGSLPVVIAVSESKPISTGSSAMSAEVLVYCFEILSELCSVDFEAYTQSRSPAGEEINVITTLTRLSELHQLTTHTTQTALGGSQSYYERGDSMSLAFAPLLVCMKKTPSSTNSVKKNLELQATFQVPGRKWLPEATATPREPPPLECGEIPLTEGSQTMPSEIKNRIKGLPALGKEPLVRDERSDPEPAGATHQTPDTQEQTPTTENGAGNDGDNDEFGTFTVATLTSSRRSTVTKKQLQRGHAGRNLSLASSTALLL